MIAVVAVLVVVGAQLALDAPAAVHVEAGVDAGVAIAPRQRGVASHVGGLEPHLRLEAGEGVPRGVARVGLVAPHGYFRFEHLATVLA